MDKIKTIITQIKYLFNESGYDSEKILSDVMEMYSSEIDKNGFNKKDISFLIDLCIGNIDLSSDILKDIFLNSKNKIEQKILVSTVDPALNTTFNNIELDNQTLSIFSCNGSIFIKPNKVFLLWNSKNGNKYLSHSSLKNKSKRSSNTSIVENNNIEIKLINYSVFLDREDSVNDNSLLSEISKNYLRNFGIEKGTGFQTRFQLIIALDNDNTFTSLDDPYLGDASIFLDDRYEKFKFDNSEDIYKAVGRFRSNLISLFSQNNLKILNLIKLFISNHYLYPYIDIIFKSLQKEKALFPKKEINLFQYVEEKQVNNIVNQLFLTEPCSHEAEYKKVYLSGDYFNNVNDFIKNFINYVDGRAICVLCNETIKELNIQAAFFIDKEKFITTPDNILLYQPYNKFNNLKFFMDNLFYVFMFNTKMGIFNTTMVTRMLVDNLILVSSKRIELEIDYKKDIADENIFLLRLTNNFFEAYDLEKERYKEKRMMYTNLPAYIIILITASLQDYYDFFFLKKRIKLNKINTDWTKITFEDILSNIIISIFKNTVENYLNVTEKNRIAQVKRTIQIYYEIFNDEFKLLYEEKKIVFENYLKRLSERIHTYQIGHIGNFMNGGFATEFNSFGQYLLNVNKVDMLKHEKERSYYQKRNMTHEDVNENVNIETEKVKDFLISKTWFDKNNRILNLNLFEIENYKTTSMELEELNQVCFEFSNGGYYSYNNEKYNILSLDGFYILDSEKNKIQFEDTDLLDIKPLNKYSNKILVDGDIFLYITDIKTFHFEYILRKFFTLISKKYNIVINSNITKYCKNNFKNRRELFLLKIKILNLITKLNI